MLAAADDEVPGRFAIDKTLACTAAHGMLMVMQKAPRRSLVAK
jgi:hypothetical protein